VDDITFSYHRASGPESSTVLYFNEARYVASPVRRRTTVWSSLSECGTGGELCYLRLTRLNFRIERPEQLYEYSLNIRPIKPVVCNFVLADRTVLLVFRYRSMLLSLRCGVSRADDVFLLSSAGGRGPTLFRH